MKSISLNIKLVATGILTMLLVAIFATARDAGLFMATEKTQFMIDSSTKQNFVDEQKAKNNKLVTNKDGTLKYLSEDFDGYAKNSTLIDSFDDITQIQTEGTVGPFELSSDKNYEGRYSLGFNIAPNKNNQVVVSKSFSHPLNIWRWKDSGYVTMWMNIQDRKGISGVTLKLGDAAGAYREFKMLPNLQTDFPNFMNDNDAFVDLPYPEKTSASEWTDFWLNKGWNYLPWRIGAGYTKDHENVDFTNITWYEILLTTTSKLPKQHIMIDDLRIQDGLQKEKNVVGGNWAPPLGMPQYGVYDINQIKPGDYVLNLLNVRPSQYPSNGDHGRLLSKNGTPDNFTFRTRFAVNDVGPSTNNTWLRIFYDFDPIYDPGHDWFGTYFSFDYKKFGLLTVIPLERFSMQTQEPLESQDEATFRKTFVPKPNTQYEYNLTVHGQHARATVYEVTGDRLIQRATVDNTFTRKRYKDKRYPIGIEITGNIKATVYNMELVEL